MKPIRAVFAAALLATIPAPVVAHRSDAAVQGEADARRAADAYVWGYPLVVTERTLQLLAARAPVNRLTFQPARSGLSSRAIVAPNTDTLYAAAPLDLRGEPYVLTVPAIRDRYYSFQLISAYTESFAYVGTRATRGRAGRWAITPPGWHGRLPRGITRLRSPTPQLLLLGRFAVIDDADVAAVRALGHRITLEPLSSVIGAPAAPAPPPLGSPVGTPQSTAAAGAGFFDELGDALAINPPVGARERRRLRDLASLGIGPGRHPSAEAPSPARRAVLAAGVEQGERRLAAAVPSSTRTVNGWSVNPRVGRYGNDAVLRARVARTGWGANVPEEAIYATSLAAADGTPYDGAHRYVLHFPHGRLPPVDAFWSVTLYGPDRFFTANPIDRYAIAGRTPGLEHGKDGSLDIFVSHEPPQGHETNWLPAPAGPFVLVMRLYLPGSRAIRGAYRYPPVRAVA